MDIGLHEKLWRLSVTGLEGLRISHEEEKLIGDNPPAGIILFARNVRDRDQVTGLISRLRELRSDILVMADHEGGAISVLADAAGIPPPQLAVGSAEDPELRRAAYAETAQRVRSLGIPVLLTPVADINTEEDNPVIGARAFPGSAEQVSRRVTEAVKTYREEGMLTCLKHFPGHGCTSTDSHFTLPRVPALSEKSGRQGLLPFSAGIDAGAEMVMTGHLRTGESSLPASVDSEVIAILRNKLGFGGAVITDALEMKGAREASGPAGHAISIAAEAFRAGNDILLFSDPACRAFEDLRAEIVTAAENGNLSVGEIENGLAESSERVDALLKAAGRPFSGRGPESRRAPDPYRRVASAVCRVQGDRGRCSPPFRCLFLGERTDFELRPAHYYIQEALDGMGIGDAGQLRSEEAYDYIGSNLIRSERGENLFELIFEDTRGGRTTVLFDIRRRPPGRKDSEPVYRGADVIVLSGYPPRSGYLPEDRPAVLTLGVYPAAARVATELIRG